MPRAGHTISRAHVSPNALKVLYRLKDAGFQAFLVGGAVRDLLLGIEPKDFDVATNAHPEQVRKLFRNCRLIGRRFHLAHVRFGMEIIEVATFRAAHTEVDEDHSVDEVEHRVLDEHGRILRDNLYGSIGEDVWRRDFTANALYYNIADFSIWDYAGGVDDIRAGVLRLIGDPEDRYREDPVRLLRAVRHPACRVLGHPTGRLLLAREGYAVDLDAVLAACAEHGVAVEINASPYRLDLDWRWARRALDLGVRLVINPDAHSAEGLTDVRWGLAIARKAGATASDLVNCSPIEEFLSQR